MVLSEKIKRNKLEDIDVINYPSYIDKWVDKDAKGKPIISQNCETYFYAAYLPPGLHQAVILDPETGEVFCREFIVNLNSFDHFPEYPEAACN